MFGGRRSKDEPKNFNKDLAVAEGVKTSLAVHLLAQKLGVEMPICFSVYEVIHKGAELSKSGNYRPIDDLDEGKKDRTSCIFMRFPDFRTGVDIKTALRRLQDRPLREEHDEYQGTWVWSAL